MLQRRKKNYTVRVHVPADLRPVIGRREITKSLRTSNQQDARLRDKQWQAHLASLFGHLRRHGHTMTADQLDALVQRYLAARWQEIEERLALAAYDGTLEPSLREGQRIGREVWVDSLYDSLEAIRSQLAEGDYRDTTQAARELLNGQGDYITLATLARRLLEAKHEALCAEIDAAGGQPLRRLNVTSVTPQAAPGAPSQPRKSVPQLSQIIEAFVKSRVQAGKWTPKTIGLFTGRLNTCLELLGDRPVDEYTHDDLETLQAELKTVPTNARTLYTNGEGEPLPIPEAIKRANAAGNTRRLSATTINLHTDALQGAFKYAITKRAITSSPFVGFLKLEEQAKERKPYTDEQLRAFFGSLKGAAKKSPARWWIPHLLLYTGARLNEACQLHAEDIRQEFGIWYMDINEQGDTKRVKTGKSGCRTVPIHSRLIGMGFVEFATKRTAGHLFPELPYRETDGYMDKMEKWGSRYLREKLKIADPEIVAFHSFRHTVATRLGSAGVDGQMIDKLQGWKPEGMRARYTHEFDLRDRQAAIEKLSYPV